MKRENKRKLWVSLSSFAAFAVWTVLILFVDRAAIGPRGSYVGFSTMNEFVHSLFGVHMGLYNVTDWLGLVPIAIAFAFAVLGFVQMVKRRSLLKVDRSILALGGFYLFVIFFYFLFEEITVNFRPILIDGCLETSYPSSTTLLTMCVMPSAIMQLNTRIKGDRVRRFITVLFTSFTAFMVIGRLVSGVHWFSDIIGGALLSLGLVMLYNFVSDILDN